jgi:AraC-like DNA-binding protein
MPDLVIDFAAVERPDEPLLLVAAGTKSDGLESAKHQHARGQLFASTRGLLSVGVEDGLWVVPAIHAVWLPPHTVHHGRSHGPFEGWNVYVAEPACADLPARPCAIRISGLLREAVLRAASWTPGPFDAARLRVAGVILDEIHTLPSEPLGLPIPSDPRLARIARALLEDPADGRDLDAWAAWSAVSARTLSRRFVSETGFTFTAWRQRARLLCALRLLADGVPVSTIALDLGYSTASAFISLFRRTFGETPSSYRRNL